MLGLKIGLAATLAAVASAAVGQGQAPETAPVAGVAVNLNITPKRLVFDRSTRAGTVYIFNQGNAPATFDIALVDRVMLPNGEIKAVTETAEDSQLQPLVTRLNSARPLLIATPRRVTLAPGRGQTIRIRATQPAGGASEYRTHLTVTTIPPRENGVTADQALSQAPGQLSFQITSVFGLSIPVIVRTGPADIRAAIENARVATAEASSDGARGPVLHLDLARLGANSLFGNLEVRAVRGRDHEVIGLARGVGVYPEIERRAVQIPLGRAARAGEQIEVIFSDDDSSPGRVIARAVLPAT